MNEALGKLMAMVFITGMAGMSFFAGMSFQKFLDGIPK